MLTLFRQNAVKISENSIIRMVRKVKFTNPYYTGYVIFQGTKYPVIRHKNSNRWKFPS